MEELNTPEKITQWVLDNRYSKGENNSTSNFELYHIIVDSITKIKEAEFQLGYTEGWNNATDFHK